MRITISAEGLNPEKLLRAAAAEGIRLRQIRREEGRRFGAEVSIWHLARLRAIAEGSGFVLEERSVGPLVFAARRLRARWTLAASMLLCAAMVSVSSRVLLCVQIDHAGKEEAAVRSVLRDAGAVPGQMLSCLSSDRLRAQLEYALPGLAFAGVRFAGSTMIVDCRPAVEPQTVGADGKALDIVAARDGVVTRIWALSGTPLVEPGEAVHAGQVLIRGEERTQQGQTSAVRAQGEVMARVWTRGDASARLYTDSVVETGRMRRRVTMKTPWGSRTLTEAEPFESQSIDVREEPVCGLYLPVVRITETFVENSVVRMPANRADAMSTAQGAAERIAKNNCPINARILDKWVDYSMIDNEFVYATVVLEYEQDIASRL
ncbi:MAG: sporulation protein YqfD [Clostridia bacterium]|nr:sporulation protein YqfD [Clostridia bacterium]